MAFSALSRACAPHPSAPEALVFEASGWLWVRVEPRFSASRVASLDGFEGLVWLNATQLLGARGEALVLLDWASGVWVEREALALEAEILHLLRLTGTKALVEVNTLPWPTIYAYEVGQPLKAFPVRRDKTGERPLPVKAVRRSIAPLTGGGSLKVVENIHSSLDHAVPLGEQVLYWGGGVQASEVRVATRGGAWRADTSHHRPVRCVAGAPDQACAVSLDASGLMLCWGGAVARARFWFSASPQSLPSERCALLNGSVDLSRKRLWMSARGQTTEVWGLGADLPSGVWRAPHLQRIVHLAAHPRAALVQDQAGAWSLFDLDLLA